MRIRGATEKQLSLKGNVQLVVNDKTEELIRKIEKYIERKSDFEPDVRYDGFTSEEMNNIYELLKDKLTDTVYKKDLLIKVNSLRNIRRTFRAFLYKAKRRLSTKLLQC